MGPWHTRKYDGGTHCAVEPGSCVSNSGRCEGSQSVAQASALRKASYRCPLCSGTRRCRVARATHRCGMLENAKGEPLQWLATQEIVHASARRETSQTWPSLSEMRRARVAKGAYECGALWNADIGLHEALLTVLRCEAKEILLHCWYKYRTYIWRKRDLWIVGCQQWPRARYQGMGEWGGSAEVKVKRR